ncbi:hypothetical protein CCACVL1_24950 [Corchorus capsularis]|uniref:Uncharacterized protein n=1 Tax=Corchorus capsularis TaxID=210143 RepID=A0A1R3GMN6_COCAP|nr:hypothetical protein CCACVL1_24950 [Corchorus capsularis]
MAGAIEKMDGAFDVTEDKRIISHFDDIYCHQLGSSLQIQISAQVRYTN